MPQTGGRLMTSVFSPTWQ